MAAVSVSDEGLLAYQTGSGRDLSQLKWVDRAGKQLGVLGDPRDYGDVQLSPDGRRVAVSFFDPVGRNRDIWLLDVSRGIKTRFTFDIAEETISIWSPDPTARSSSSTHSATAISTCIGEPPTASAARARFMPTAGTSSPQAGPATAASFCTVSPTQPAPTTCGCCRSLEIDNRFRSSRATQSPLRRTPRASTSASARRCSRPTAAGWRRCRTNRDATKST